MADKAHRKLPEHDSDYDGAWKEALRMHFSPFLGKYFPAMFAAIDWSYEPTWSNKEMSQVLGTSGRRNREVDVLVHVRLHSGHKQLILAQQTRVEPVKKARRIDQITLDNALAHRFE